MPVAYCTGWYNGGLDFEWTLNNNVIKYSSITSMKLELKAADGTVLAAAESKGEKLKTLIDDCLNYWPNADTAAELSYSSSGISQDYLIGAENAKENLCWDVTVCTLANNAEVPAGAVCTITIACGDITFTGSTTK